MKSLSMTGAVAVEYFRKTLDARQADEGTARFVLDRLTGEQVAEICRSIRQSDLVDRVEIKVRESLGKAFGLPDEILTSQGLVHWRHADCDMPALLIAGVDDSEEKSFGVLMPIGARDLKGETQSWVNIAAQGLIIQENQMIWWRQALRGLLNAGEFSLDQFANYVSLTSQRIQEANVSVRDALGWGLPALGLPRDSGFFQAIPEKKIGQCCRLGKKVPGLHQAAEKFVVEAEAER